MTKRSTIPANIRKLCVAIAESEALRLDDRSANEVQSMGLAFYQFNRGWVLTPQGEAVARGDVR